MGDLDHYATRRDLLGASGGLTAPVYSVGPAGGTWAYTTIQDAVDDATGDVEAGTYPSGVVMVAPGTYAEDVLIRCDKVHLVGTGPLYSTIIHSVTITDATLVSLGLFLAGGGKGVLVTDAALTNPPRDNQIANLTIDDTTGAGKVGTALASLLILGGETPATEFANTGVWVDNCLINRCFGAAAGTGGVYACYTNVMKFTDCVVGTGMVFDQCAQAALIQTSLLEVNSKINWTYDAAAVIPDTAHSGILLYSSKLAELELNGVEGKATGSDTAISSLDVNTTAAGSASSFVNCSCTGAMDIANVGPTVIWSGGEIGTQPSGAGVAGFTQTTRLVAADTVPGTDNTRDLGTTLAAFAEIHGRTIEAHGDATNTNKTSITSNGITPTVAHTIAPTVAAADTAGKNETIGSGTGGVASAAAGGVGGTMAVGSAKGGAGTAALAAGAGGPINIIAGDAGANGGGGGADGGAVKVRSGGSSAGGGGTAGKVQIQDSGSGAVEIGNAASNPTLALLGTGAKTTSGDIMPVTDNSKNLGSSATAFAAAHARRWTSHADATDSNKTSLEANAIVKSDVTNGTALTITAAQVTNPGMAGTSGSNIEAIGGIGSAATAAVVGGAGGNVRAVAGAGGGGWGAAAGAPGAGGSAYVTAGAAGAADFAGTGNDGGNVIIAAGAATGGGTNGQIRLGLTNTSAIVFGANIRSDTDNTDSLGTTAIGYANVHSRIFTAHNDATNTIKAIYDYKGITVSRTQFDIAVSPQQATVAGDSASMEAGAGGVANGGVAAGAGAALALRGGAGGAGGAGGGELAGAGANVNIAGGAAGANIGAGGAAGGDVDIDGGASSGASKGGYIYLNGGNAPGAGAGGTIQLVGGTSAGGLAGVVQIQPTGSGTTEIGNVASNPAASFLGTGTVAVGGDLDCAGRVMGREFLRTPGAYPYNIVDDDKVVLATAGGGGVACNLPNATGSGFKHTIAHIDAGAGVVAVTPQGADSINGGGAGVAYNLAAQWNTVTVIDIAANLWLVVAHE